MKRLIAFAMALALTAVAGVTAVSTASIQMEPKSCIVQAEDMQEVARIAPNIRRVKVLVPPKGTGTKTQMLS